MTRSKVAITISNNAGYLLGRSQFTGGNAVSQTGYCGPDSTANMGSQNQTQFTQGNMRASYLVMTVRIVTKDGTTRDQLTTSLQCQRSASQSRSGEEGLRHWMAQRNEQAIALGCNQWNTAAQ